ncbi:uncharacterized protein [Procambarus clarkii]|uniref:uncharacterized protein n=2 Tax=Procambarus clarkii TaxID=6728 RepID=UPI003743A97D
MSEDFSATGTCSFYMAREDFMSMPMALAFRHRHPIFPKANQRILELVNKGLVGAWISDQLPNSTACLGASGPTSPPDKHPLALKDYYGLFTVCAFCMVGCVAVLGVEMTMARFAERRRATER